MRRFLLWGSSLLVACSGGGGSPDAGDAGPDEGCACFDSGPLPDGPPPPSGTVTVLNNSGASLVSFAADATGDVAPSATISGAQTNLSGGVGLGADSAGNVYVATQLAILVFPKGASGNVAPARTIAGPSALAATDYFAGISVAPDGTIFAASELTTGTNRAPKILVFAAGANGNVAPTQTITGSSTTMQAVLSMAVHGTTIGEADGTANVLFFNTTDNGNVAPQRSLKSGQGIVEQLAFASGGQLYLALYGFSASSAVEYAAGAQNTDAPIALITGATTTITTIGGIAVDAAGDTFVANADPTGAAILVFAPNSNGDVAPMRSIRGASTTLVGDASQYPMPIVVY